MQQLSQPCLHLFGDSAPPSLLPQVLALTFDDGPHAASLTAVLDVLKNESVPATFFVNTYAESGWLGPFNSPANVVSVGCSSSLEWLLPAVCSDCPGATWVVLPCLTRLLSACMLWMDACRLL